MLTQENLHPGLLKAIEEMGFTSLTPIQQEAIPEILQGSDLFASAQTGTGKTAAFLIPILQKLTVPSTLSGKGPRALILVPTRELAMQVEQEALKLSKRLQKVKTVCVYGGTPYPVQNRQLARPFEILIATPGRLIDHMQRNRIDFSRLEMWVLDEADRMLDMGFIEPVEKIAASLPQERQTLMFSATLDGSVRKLSNRLLNDPKEICLAPRFEMKASIEQRLHPVDDLSHKYRLLEHFLEDPEMQQVIIFTATKSHADELADRLRRQGLQAAALHGDMNQRQRSRTMVRLRNEEIRILVATDVAARGIDIPTISHVINFDLPFNAEDYVHRIGRTGRAGATGIALSFATPRERQLVRSIEQFTGQKMTPHIVPGMEPTLKSEPRPKKHFGKRPFKRSFQRKRY